MTRASRFLQLIVLGAAAILVALNVLSYQEGSGLASAVFENDSQRNERSTPRNFVLPATPGVALEQERHAAAMPGEIDSAARCIAQLTLRGYQIYGDFVMDNVKVLEAVVQFQVASGLPVSGTLDETTRRALECNFD